MIKTKATLRIKKKYFDLIASGEKKVEYRSKSDFYDRLLDNKPEVLMLHYQGKERLLVEVKDVQVNFPPEEFKNKGLFSTDLVYEIYLGKVIKKWTQDS